MALAEAPVTVTRPPSFVIDVVEAAYSLEGSEVEWLERILANTAPQFPPRTGLVGMVLRSAGGRQVHAAVAPRGCAAPLVALVCSALRQCLAAPPGSGDGAGAAIAGGRTGELQRLDLLLPALDAATREALVTGLDAHDVDALFVAQPDGDGGFIALVALLPRRVAPPPPHRAGWRRVSAHLATASRLRQRASGTATLLDAARDPSARQTSPSPDDLWQGLLSGRWSLVADRWIEGRRRIVAHRNDRARDPRGLTPRESSIVELALTGASNKHIALTLGIGERTVSGYLSMAIRKLGLSGRLDLVGCHALRRGTVSRVPIGDDVLDVLVAEPAPEPGAAGTLSAAERAVAELACAGYSNAQIARRRGRSERTIANQLAQVYRKLRIGSRAELVVALRA